MPQFVGSASQQDTPEQVRASLCKLLKAPQLKIDNRQPDH